MGAEGTSSAPCCSVVHRPCCASLPQLSGLLLLSHPPQRCGCPHQPQVQLFSPGLCREMGLGVSALSCCKLHDRAPHIAILQSIQALLNIQNFARNFPWLCCLLVLSVEDPSLARGFPFTAHDASAAACVPLHHGHKPIPPRLLQELSDVLGPVPVCTTGGHCTLSRGFQELAVLSWALQFFLQPLCPWRGAGRAQSAAGRAPTRHRPLAGCAGRVCA